jgi:hypothetical protein
MVGNSVQLIETFREQVQIDDLMQKLGGDDFKRLAWQSQGLWVYLEAIWDDTAKKVLTADKEVGKVW